MKPVGVKSKTYIDYSKGINDKNPQLDDNVRISIFNFAKDYTQNWFCFCD